MKESKAKTVRERIDAMMADRLPKGVSGERRSLIKAAWERLTPAEEWASHRSFRMTAPRRTTA